MSKSYRKMPWTGRVVALLGCEDSTKSIVSEALDRVGLTYAGIPDDTHAGLTRSACTRFPELYAEGVEIRNTRQLTLVSSEELAQIAAAMEIDEVRPGWLGANLEVSGIPALTLLPPSTRLVFASGATLVVDIENRPCAYPALVIDEHYPGKGRRFIRAAKQRRGFTAWVEREGDVAPGDAVDVFFPDQAPHPDQFPRQ